jgi:hypothetical protein
MRNLLPQKDKYLMNFANSVYAEFQKMRYGIQSCTSTGELWLNEIRKDIANYQSNDDGEALSQVSVQHMGWLPVYYPTSDESCDYQPPWCDVSKYQVQRCNGGPTSVGMSYVGQNNSANLIEVNAGGCITRININPAITINNNTGTAFTFTQPCNQPQTVWNINHNLGYTPNVWAEDCSNPPVNIEGTVHVVDPNTITLTFSSAQAGKAYLS